VRVRSFRRLAPLLGLLIVVASVGSAVAFGHAAAAPKPKVIGNAIAGKTAFTSAGCGSCHALSAAKAKGTIGPSLDAETLTEAKIVLQITKGGYTVMGAAAKKKYPFPMSAFKGKLTTAQIQNIAAFVVSKRTGKAAPSSSSSTTTTSTTSTTSTTTTTATTTAAGTTTTTTSSGSPDGCPTGKTIATSGSNDGDDDDTGGFTDGDGCI
jgi:mono/diheme cytochrome c family protein